MTQWSLVRAPVSKLQTSSRPDSKIPAMALSYYRHSKDGFVVGRDPAACKLRIEIEVEIDLELVDWEFPPPQASHPRGGSYSSSSNLRIRSGTNEASVASSAASLIWSRRIWSEMGAM